MRWITFACVALSACAFLPNRPACADDKPALSGTWIRPGGEPKIDFTKKDVLKISPHGDEHAIVIVCEYKSQKDGRVKVKVTDYEGDQELKTKIKEFVPLGLEFNFKWQVKDDAATLDDLKGDKVDHLKSHLEGKYEQKK